MEIKLVVFNLIGTTVQDESILMDSFKEALTREGVEFDELLDEEIIDLPKRTAIKRILSSQLEDDEEIDLARVEKINRSFLNIMTDYYINNPVYEKDGVTETFQILKENNIKIAIDSGFDYKLTRIIIERLGWFNNGFIDATVCLDDVENAKPFPDLILRAMELTGIEDSTKVAKVGSSPYDLIEGTAAGCGLVIGVTSKFYSEEDLMSVHHQCFVHDIQEIPSVLKLSTAIYSR